MRILLCLLLCCASLACAKPTKETIVEHAPDAGSSGYMAATVYCLRNGVLSETQKQLPWQTDMERYALSFVLDDPHVQYSVRLTNGQATVDIASFPPQSDADAEAAAVLGVVNTMLAFSNVESVQLTFDGESLRALPHGTAVDLAFSEPIRMDAGE